MTTRPAIQDLGHPVRYRVPGEQDPWDRVRSIVSWLLAILLGIAVFFMMLTSAASPYPV